MTVFPLGAQAGCGDEAIAHVKLFVPGSRWTLFVSEHDPAEALAFGWVVSALGPDCDVPPGPAVGDNMGGLPRESDPPSGTGASP